MNEKEIRKIVTESVRQTVPLVLAQRVQTRQSGYKATEQRLYAYPVLVDNVRNRWPKDIEDLKQELAVMDRALNTIKTAPAYPWLTAFYFDGKDMDVIAEEYGTTRQQVARAKAMLVRVLALRLYGAEALE